MCLLNEANILSLVKEFQNVALLKIWNTIKISEYNSRFWVQQPLPTWTDAVNMVW